jgi:hypothetical protein
MHHLPWISPVSWLHESYIKPFNVSAMWYTYKNIVPTQVDSDSYMAGSVCLSYLQGNVRCK